MAAKRQTTLSKVKTLAKASRCKPTFNKKKMTSTLLSRKGSLWGGLLQALWPQVFLLCQVPNSASAWPWHKVHQEGDVSVFKGKDKSFGNTPCWYIAELNHFFIWSICRTNQSAFPSKGEKLLCVSKFFTDLKQLAKYEMYSKMAMNWKQTHTSFINNNRGEREKKGKIQ